MKKYVAMRKKKTQKNPNAFKKNKLIKAGRKLDY